MRALYDTLNVAKNGAQTLLDQVQCKILIDDICSGKYERVYDKNDLLFFQQYKPQTDDNEEQELSVVYQNQFMREMLLQYGQEIVCLDATYKTTKVT